MTISVIIPARNEASWLGRLLEVLRSWDPEAEIVVADHDSTDRTLEIAAAYGCRTVQGGRPATGRNLGVAAARGEYLLFVDADVVPTKQALTAALDHSRRAEADVVGFRHVPLSDDRSIRAFYRVADLWFGVAARLGRQQSLASFLLVRRRCFENLGGFDESLDPGEDVDFVRRASRVGRARYLKAPVVLVSPRRFSTEPKYWFALKTAVWGAMRTMGIRATLLAYRWLRHDPIVASDEANWLRHHPRYGG